MTEEEMEKAIQRHARRYKTFMDEGLCEQQAWELADKMWERDNDPYDDRRVCFECKNYVGRHCMKMKDRQGKPQMPMRFILQRCEHFELKGVK